MWQKIILFLAIGFIIFSTKAQKNETLALTPPMGWNSWNKFRCDINENVIKKTADQLIESGMKDVGYTYIVIDDCWQGSRDQHGHIQADKKKFPSGMKALADYVHQKGLKFGIYSDAGTKTCGGYPGSRGYEYIDAQTYADWGVDFLKYDWCHTVKNQNAEASYITMRDALAWTGRPILLSICEWGSNEPWKWAGDVGHMWRTTVDITGCFECETNWGGLGVLNIIDKQVKLREFSGPGKWNDPDMLEIGNGYLTLEESRTHFSMWAMLAAPLFAGNDLTKMTHEIKAILTNKEVIAIDQDPLGDQAIKWRDYGDLEVWFKVLSNNEYAVCYLNRGEEPHILKEKLAGKTVFDLIKGRKSYPLTGEYFARDLWSHTELGTINKPFTKTIASHDVFMIKVYKK